MLASLDRFLEADVVRGRRMTSWPSIRTSISRLEQGCPPVGRVDRQAVLSASASRHERHIRDEFTDPRTLQDYVSLLKKVPTRGELPAAAWRLSARTISSVIASGG